MVTTISYFCLMLKGVGGLADPLSYHFPQGNDRYNVTLSCQSVWLCLETAFLHGSGDALQLQGKICDVNAKVSVLGVNKPTYTSHFMPLTRENTPPQKWGADIKDTNSFLFQCIGNF